MQWKKLTMVVLLVVGSGTQVAALAQQSVNPSLGERLGALFSRSSESKAEDELIEPERAFQLTLRPVSGNLVRADFTPAPGYYMYRERIAFKLKDAEKGTAISEVKLPQGKRKPIRPSAPPKPMPSPSMPTSCCGVRSAH
ncbi:MAG TPA: protein-disulfide reductase DsbD N-terminal domain-containing protein, partial [Noviherbaspirillum sp.]